MTTPLTVNGSAVITLSGAAVTMRAEQLVHTIFARPAAGGMTLTLPTPNSLVLIAGANVVAGAQSDFTLVNKSTTDNVSVVTDIPIGDMELQADHSATFRMLWSVVKAPNAKFALIRIGGTDSSGEIVSVDPLVITSSSGASPAITIATSAQFADIDIQANGSSAGVNITGNLGGVNLDANLGTVALTSINTSEDAINLDTTGDVGGIRLDSGFNGLILRSVGTVLLDSTGGAINVDASAGSGTLNLDAGTGGVRINPTGTRLGFYNTGPVTQRSTVIAGAPIDNMPLGEAVLEDTEFAGYTIGQIVTALQEYGLLA